tara:strand:- start:79533 stop:81770 length:2238 start_codon:yes stop_codon:yes gene_type:complete
VKTVSAFVTGKKTKWITIAIWIMFVFLASQGPTLIDVTENNASSFLPKGADSTKALEISRSSFPSDGIPLMIIFSNQDGLTKNDFKSGEQIYNWLNSDDAPNGISGLVSIYNIPNARSDLISPDESTMNMIVNVIGEPSSDAFTDLVKSVRDFSHQYRTNELEINIGGPGGLIVDLVAVFASIDVFLLVASAILVLVLLIIIYRSPVIPFVPLFAVSFVYFIAGAVGALLAQQFGFNVNGQASGIMTIILFGSGTDYCLFVSSRYKEELIKHQDKHQAMNIAVNAVGPAVLSSGSTILVASAILLLATLGSSAALGPVLAVALLIMMLAAVTFVPAILLILGRVAFWPAIPKYESDPKPQRKIYGVIASWVLDRPKKVLVVSGIILALFSSGIFLYSPNYDSLASLPAETESVQGFKQLRSGFPAGEISPTNAYFVVSDGLNQNNFNALNKIANDILLHPNVADVASLIQPFGQNGPRNNFELFSPTSTKSMNSNHIAIKQNALKFVSADFNVYRLDIVFDENPFKAISLDSIIDIRSISNKNIDELGLVDTFIYFGGDTAEATDTRTAINRDNIVILPLVLLSIGVILAILLKSLIAPIYLCLTILVTYAATLGISLFSFEYFFGHSGISPGTMFYLFVFLNALGVDYNIYVMSRIREEARKKELNSAIKDALSFTGGVITSAGLILAGTFAVFMTLPLIDLFQLGFAVAIGVIMDTFVTRTVIVPAIVSLLGDKNWWPNKQLI